MRMIKILMKNSLMTPEVQKQIKHNRKNLINLDESESSSLSEEVQIGGTGSSSAKNKQSPKT